MVVFVGCAADPGDLAKVLLASPSPTGDVDASQQATVDAGSRPGYGSPDATTSTTNDDSSVTTPPVEDSSVGTAPGEDTSVVTPPGNDATTPPVEDGGTEVVDTGPPDAGFTGAGCAPGALIVVIPKSDASTCGHSGNFMAGNGTLGPVCVEFQGSVPGGWNASNASGCSITVTGGGTTQMVTGTAAAGTNQPAMPAGPDGFVYWNLTAGCIDFASIQCF